MILHSQRWTLIVIPLISFAARPVAALEAEGFAEPHRTIEVASVETGILAEVLVHEGDNVQPGQPLARLNSEVHLALLAMAEQGMNARGRLDAALAEMHLRQDRLKKLETLLAEGHARQEEVDRAQTELLIAEGNVVAAREDLLLKRLEHERIKTQLEHRTICSPIAGVVTSLHKQLGEFVAPNDPKLLTVVELDPLMATFSLIGADANRLKRGESVRVRFPVSGQTAQGTIAFIAPVTDAESGAVQFKVRIANPDGRYRSGEPCVVALP